MKDKNEFLWLNDLKIIVPVASHEVMQEAFKQVSKHGQAKILLERALAWELAKRGMEVDIPFDNDPPARFTFDRCEYQGRE